MQNYTTVDIISCVVWNQHEAYVPNMPTVCMQIRVSKHSMTPCVPLVARPESESLARQEEKKKKGARGALYMRYVHRACLRWHPYNETIDFALVTGYPVERAMTIVKREGCCCSAIARQMRTVSVKTLSRSSREFTRFERRRNHVRYSAVHNRVAESNEERVEAVCWIHFGIKSSVSFDPEADFD